MRCKNFKSENFQIRLFNRENGFYPNGCAYTFNKKFYQNILPNLTIANIIKPASHLTKFSPDGKFLLAFSYDAVSLEVYYFKGTSAGGELISLFRLSSDLIYDTESEVNIKIRESIFFKLFKLKYRVKASVGLLKQDCSLFTDDGRFIIVAAVQQKNLQPTFILYNSNEFVTHSSFRHLEDYFFYLIDLKLGKIRDIIILKDDQINLSQNEGIYIYKKRIAILSVFKQTISIYNLSNGKFKLLYRIGRFCSKDESEMYNRVYPSATYHPLKEITINSLKHHLLVFLYRKACNKTLLERNHEGLQNFYKHFDFFNNLKILEMQLLDDDHLLIKYCNIDSITKKPTNKLTLLVFYNISGNRILQIYDFASKEFLSLFKNFCDYFRNDFAISELNKHFPTSSPSNSIHYNYKYQKSRKSVRNFCSVSEISEKLLTQFPCRAQYYSQSPYLDLELFSYDDEFVSNLQTPKPIGEYPIKDSGIFKFRMHLNTFETESTTKNNRHLVETIFHPFEPFAISVCRNKTYCYVNFHLHSENS